MSKLIRWLELAAMCLAMFAVACIALIISLDTFLRYAFNAPLQVSYELVSYYLMVVFVYFGVSATFTAGDHVNITIFRDSMPPRVVALVDFCWVMVAAVIFGIMVYGNWHNVVDAWVYKDFLFGYIPWPAWLSYLPIPLGVSILVLRLVHHALSLAVKGHDPEVVVHGEAAE